MRKFLVAGVVLSLACAGSLAAQPPSLTFGEDYTVGDAVASVTMVKVAPNRIDHYLAGLKESWVPGVEIAQEMGLNTGYFIFLSEIPESGLFNITLVVNFENMAQREKGNDPEIAAELQRKIEEKLSEQESFKITEGYTQIRTIVDEQLMRLVTLK